MLCDLFLGRKPFPSRTIEDLKSYVKILFIDDEYFSIVKQLKEKDNWKYVSRISDVDSISQPEIADAHIILVDIQGVGKKMNFSDGGLGLILAIHHEYPEKKIIMYSAEVAGKIDAFHSAQDAIDGRLRKTASRYEFDSKIAYLAQEIFCLDSCIKHIKEVLWKEIGVNMSEEEIKKVIEKIYSKGEYSSPQKIAKYFKLSDIGSVASIIQLLCSFA